MRILIINPPYTFPIIREGRCQSPQNMRKNSIPQMTLAYVAGILERDGHELRVYDCIASNVMREKLFEDMDSFAPKLALVNTCTPTIDSDMLFISSLKARYRDTVVAAFGTHVTALHREVLEANPSLDIAIRNEPENVVKDIARVLENGGPLHELLGCTVRADGEIRVNDDKGLPENLDAYGRPAWKYLPIENYVHPIFNKPYLMINTSRGCMHRCIFCVAHQFYGRKVRFRSIPDIIEEIKKNMADFGVRHFWFYADDFTRDTEFVENLCRAIISEKLDIVWWSNTRVDKTDDKMFSIMKKSGCYMLSVGGESGNPDILKRIRKGTKPEQIINTIKTLRRVRINSVVYFLIGLPGENRDTIEETVEFAKKINPDYVEFYPATPYPGTEFHEIAAKEGMIADTDWASYQCGGDRFVIRIPGVTKEDLDKILRKAYREFYLRPAYALILLRKAVHPGEFIRLMGFGFGYFKRFVSRSE